jgi:phenylalanyl-tRNA synthetase alpha chain
MRIDDKVRKTLAELRVSHAAGVEALFAEVRAAMESERQSLVSRGAPNEHERNRLAKGLRDRWLARKNGILSSMDEKWLKPARRELKPAVGREFNSLRKDASAVEISNLLSVIPIRESATLQAKGAELRAEEGSPSVTIKHEARDLTLPGNRRPLGSIHPVTRVMREIEDIFLGLGFTIETGPEIETTYYNFDALNIPESHPARDDWDTLYIDSKTVLRTHTSPVQIHAMKKHGAPLYIICPGKCYRHDNPDSSHATMFHQVEGLAVDTDITFADLKGTLDFFARKFFGERIRTNFFPSFFPFTEPSGDVAISCTICDGQGCRVCKESGWLEVMGCGMVHPDVLEHGGIDSKKFSGWAFGLGVERFAMMKYGINDIQLFAQSDVRFLDQF